MRFSNVFKKRNAVDETFNGFVIYEGQDGYNLREIGNNYLKAAKNLAKPFKDAVARGFPYQEDIIAHPCVFLIRHSIECYLKYYLISLIDYNQVHPFFKLNRDWKKFYYKEHKLKNIADFIWEIVRHTSIFQNIKFKSHLKFFDEFDKIDNYSTAFRYSTDNKGKRQQLHSDQWYVDILSFLEMVELLRDEIFQFTEGWLFKHENYVYFDDSTIKDIEQALDQFRAFYNMVKKSDFLCGTAGRWDKNPSFVQGENSRSDEELRLYFNLRTELKLKVRNYFKDEDLVSASDGMYFGRGDGFSKGKISFDEAFDALIARVHCFGEFQDNSERYLLEIKKYKRIKDEAHIFDV